MKRLSILSFALIAIFFPKASALNEGFLSTLNIGWPSQLEALNQQTNDGKSYLVVVVLQPSPAIDIESAETLRRSLIESAADGDESVLGHVMFGWKCVGPKGNYHGMTGMTGESKEQIYKMSKNGWGYNAMMSTYTDGYLQNSKEIQKEEIHKKLKQGKTFVTLGFEVSPQECANFYKALTDFVTHPNVPMSRFGSMTNPDHYTGGGCVSTALSMLTKSMAFPASIYFRRNMSFNKKFLGKGSTVSPHTELPPAQFWQDKKHISFDTFVFSSWEVKPKDEVINVQMEDPELLIAFLKSAIGVASKSSLSAGQLTSRTYKSIQPDPSGEDPYGVNRRFSWTHYTKTADNNASYRQMYDLANSWLAQRAAHKVIRLNLIDQDTVLLKK